jgi:hypothetical protein
LIPAAGEKITRVPLKAFWNIRHLFDENALQSLRSGALEVAGKNELAKTNLSMYRVP